MYSRFFFVLLKRGKKDKRSGTRKGDLSPFPGSKLRTGEKVAAGFPSPTEGGLTDGKSLDDQFIDNKEPTFLLKIELFR